MRSSLKPQEEQNRLKSVQIMQLVWNHCFRKRSKQANQKNIMLGRQKSTSMTTDCTLYQRTLVCLFFSSCNSQLPQWEGGELGLSRLRVSLGGCRQEQKTIAYGSWRLKRELGMGHDCRGRGRGTRQWKWWWAWRTECDLEKWVLQLNPLPNKRGILPFLPVSRGYK